jgi:predicted ATP-dependent serine protease
MPFDPYHELLTTRYVCEACLTRYFMPYTKCSACGQLNRIVPLTMAFYPLARSDEELREIIAAGQQMPLSKT